MSESELSCSGDNWCGFEIVSPKEMRCSMLPLIVAGVLIASSAFAAEETKSPVADNPIVQISGRVTRVDAFRPGEGMPAVIVDVNGTATRVVLGSIRYLMEQDFNLKAGTEVRVRGYKLPAAVVAIEVRRTEDGKTLTLRDENGWPLWRGGGGYARCCGKR
jgi:hypothetical protein